MQLGVHGDWAQERVTSQTGRGDRDWHPGNPLGNRTPLVHFCLFSHSSFKSKVDVHIPDTHGPVIIGVSQ